jgi:hypothetical protein
MFALSHDQFFSGARNHHFIPENRVFKLNKEMPMARVSSNVISYSSAISTLFEMGLPTSRGKA